MSCESVLGGLSCDNCRESACQFVLPLWPHLSFWGQSGKNSLRLGELVNKFYFWKPVGGESVSLPLCSLNPHSPLQILSSWHASVLSHTCLLPSLPQLYFLFFLYFPIPPFSNKPTCPSVWQGWQLPTVLPVTSRGCSRRYVVCGMLRESLKSAQVCSYSPLLSVSPSLQAPPGSRRCAVRQTLCSSVPLQAYQCKPVILSPYEQTRLFVQHSCPQGVCKQSSGYKWIC